MLKKIFIAVIVLLAVALAALAVYFIWFKDDTTFRVRSVATNQFSTDANDFSESRLFLYRDTFTIEILFGEEKIFSGVGKWKKSGQNYTFTYIDMWQKEPDGMFQIIPSSPITYAKNRNGILIEHQGSGWYFKN